MRGNTLVMLVLAIVFGAAAVLLSNVWLANQNTQAAGVPDDAILEDMVVVAAAPLRFGERLTAESLKEIPWTADALPTGAFRSKDELLGDTGEERQVLTPFEPNEPILNWKITGPGQRATLSATLSEGMRAVAVRVNDVLGVAGFVLPGDRVDILLTRSTREDGYVDVLLQNVKVLAIDQSANDREENPTVVKTVTLEVDTEDAQRLTLAAGVGQLSLALREVANADLQTTRRISINELIGVAPPAEIEPGVDTSPDEPVQPVENAEAVDLTPESVAVRPRVSNIVSVGVTRGLQRDTYDVPRTLN